ncbi:MAG TPA: SUKH-4 family immunity protein [Micromonospora sp.]|nr:MAG: hypothetical protein DIU79_07660 [Actinomycetota bacterium]
MTITHSQLLAHWGPRRLIYFPLDRFLEHIRVGPEAFPPEGALPLEVPILFTVAVDVPDVELFSLLRVQVGVAQPILLIVIGCVPDEPSMLYCLNPATGSIVLFDTNPDHPGWELVNTSFAAFVEFLYRFDELIQSDPGGAERVELGRELRQKLVEVDPLAFEDPESWWNVAFQQLLASAPPA